MATVLRPGSGDGVAGSERFGARGSGLPRAGARVCEFEVLSGWPADWDGWAADLVARLGARTSFGDDERG